MGELAYWGASVLDVAASREIWQPRRCLLDRPSASLRSPSVLSTLQAAWRAKLLSAPVQHAAAGRTSVVEPTEVAAKTVAFAVCCRRAPVAGGAAVFCGCWWGLGSGSADEATTTGEIVSVCVLLDRTGARTHPRRFCISDILVTSQTTWGRRPPVCLGSRGDQYWSLFWSRRWCPSPSPRVSTRCGLPRPSR